MGLWGVKELTSLARLAILARRGEIQQTATNVRHVAAAHVDTEIRQGAVAREDDAAALCAVHGARDLAPVRRDDGRVDDEERGPRVGDRGPGPALHGLGRAAADGDLLRRELPEAVLRVDRHGGELALELGGVDVAKLVASGGAVFEVGGEDGRAERGGEVVEEGLLRLRADGVEFAEGEADEAVGRGVGDEGVGDGGGEADGLGRHGRATDVDRVGADRAEGEGAVAVGDVEGGACRGLEGGGFRGVVDRVAGLGSGG